MNRTEIAALIVPRLRADQTGIAAHYRQHHYFAVDDLLPVELAHTIYRSFPDSSRMMLRKTIRERKFVSAQMNSLSPLLEEVVYAFQDLRVVAEIAEITR